MICVQAQKTQMQNAAADTLIKQHTINIRAATSTYNPSNVAIGSWEDTVGIKIIWRYYSITSSKSSEEGSLVVALL